VKVPLRARAMVLAGQTLLIAGPPDVIGAKLRGVSAANGRTLAQTDLPDPPVFDGLIAGGGKLYLVDRAGTVTCLAGAK